MPVLKTIIYQEETPLSQKLQTD